MSAPPPHTSGSADPSADPRVDPDADSAGPQHHSDERLFHQLDEDEATFIGRVLRQETVGGALLLLVTIAALLWANSAWADSYERIRDAQLGPLTLEKWAAEGALAVFFFLAGLELKRELVVGSLRRPADALVPVAAAMGGMLVPASLYLVVVLGSQGGSELGRGWAIPMATDIAFALAVLAVVGRGLPASLRAFLLTLAIVDDLGAILVIALVYSATPHLGALLLAALGLALFAWLQHRRVHAAWLYVPLAIAVWWATHEAGLHATVAGVALGLLTRVRPDPGEGHSPAERLEHRVRPFSAGLAVPFFALLAAGVDVGGRGGLLTDPLVMGIVVGLVAGKTFGILGAAWLVARLTRAELAADLGWGDVAAVGVLAGMGFTVSLLIAELAFTGEQAETAKAGVLVGSALAAVLAAALLLVRSRTHQRARQGGRPPVTTT